MLSRLLLTCVLAAPGAADSVTDKVAPVAPQRVRLSGWLGGRVEANWKNRLLTVSLDERLKPFVRPAESQGWSGEHIGKWLHAAALAWPYSGDPGLRRRMDEAAAALTACQAPDGYLGTYAPEHRWGGWDVWTHKYNLIGLLSCYEATGNPAALAAARKIGDLLAATFGPGQRDIIRSGTHVGMAATSVLEPMVLLYRATGEARYLEFARYLVRAYDQPNGPKIVATLTQTHSVAGTANRKAYEMLSNLVGLCELYRSTGDATYLTPCLNAYDDVVENQMYVTGGTSLGEHFQEPHHLPNQGAVSENCAQVTWLQLCLQLLRLRGDAKYADTLECIVYNHLLASQQPNGEALCYFTPLEGRKPYTAHMNCCTSSGPRGIALVPTFVYLLAPGRVLVNFYEASTLTTEIDGVAMTINQATRYPLDGAVELTLRPARPVTFALGLRIPAWCHKCEVRVNGVADPRRPVSGTYLVLERAWQPGDRVQVALDLTPVAVLGTHTNAGLVAIRRGPLLLAFDSRLNPGVPAALAAPLMGPEGNVALVPAEDPEKRTAQVFRAEGRTVDLAAADGEKKPEKPISLLLTSFAEAGQTGSAVAVWLPTRERLQHARAMPFLRAQESFSRRGNVEGSIADADPTTWRVTFDGRRQAEDWFAVERDGPVTIDRVVFAHGRSYHDGGWWDASQGKPRIQIRRTPAGAWEPLAVLEAYPNTTATDGKQLAPGKEFTVRFAPLAVAGIRVVGVPACGDNPRQNFASCAELQGHYEPEKPDH